MCFVLIARQAHPRYPFVLLANRDEFYERPTEPMHEWPNPPGLLAGRDLKSGGTWMGVDKSGKLALLTNFREPATLPGQRSRGLLVLDYFQIEEDEFQRRLTQTEHHYSGFNLLYGSPHQVCYHSNRQACDQPPDKRFVPPGIHGLSNGLLDDPWPKVSRGREMLKQALDRTDPDPATLFQILEDDTPALDSALPETGVSLELERMLSPIFIRSERYGTRCSTVLLVDHDGRYLLTERTHKTGTDRVFEWKS